jgi:hypothetical protein
MALTFDSFKTKKVEICNRQRDNNMALEFAFFVYNFENAQIAKVLEDPIYWNALNKSSGEYLSVFCLYDVPQHKPTTKSNLSKQATMGFMTSLSSNYDIEDNFGEIAYANFGMGIKINDPAL